MDVLLRALNWNRSESEVTESANLLEAVKVAESAEFSESVEHGNGKVDSLPATRVFAACSSGIAEKPVPMFVVIMTDTQGTRKGFACRTWMSGMKYCKLVAKQSIATKFSIPADAAAYADEVRQEVYPLIPAVWDVNKDIEIDVISPSGD